MTSVDDFFVHEKALCESSSIGHGTRIWAFAHILPQAVLGRNCNVCDGVFIENDVIVGNDVTIKCGVQLWDGMRVGNGVFIGPNATFTNDKFPRSKVYPEGTFPQIILGDGCSIGANATILPGITIGAGAMIGAGSVVTKDVSEGAVVYGNPAKPKQARLEQENSQGLEGLDARLSGVQTLLHMLLEDLGEEGDLKLAIRVQTALAETIKFEIGVARTAMIEEVAELETLRDFEETISKALTKRLNGPGTNRPN